MRSSTCFVLASLTVTFACSGGSSNSETPSPGGRTGESGGGTGTGGASGGATPQASGGSHGGALVAGGVTSMGGASMGGAGATTGGVSSGGGSPAMAGATSSTGGSSTSGGASSNGGSAGATSRGGASSGGSAGKAGSGGSGGAQSSGGGAGKQGGGGSAGSAGSGGGTGATACANNQIAKCSGTTEIACHFGGNPGNYEVTVELGGATAGNMYVEAESYRRMLGSVTTAAGQTKKYSFVVNVRQPEGQPVQNGASDGTPGLDVYVRGSAPKLSSICYAPVAPRPKMIWIAGDSTVCDQSGTDYAGWGQHLPQFFDAPVSVANYADSGESSGSFLNGSKFWPAIKAGWAAGDWVFVQFGHNDKDTTAATFQSNMSAYVTQAKAAQLNVVLVTPISRVGYALADEHVNSTGANLPKIIRDLGKSQNVPVIDLTVTTWNWLQTITWQDYFALGTDHTHTNPKGAEAVSGFVRDAIQAQNLAFAELLR